MKFSNATIDTKSNTAGVAVGYAEYADIKNVEVSDSEVTAYQGAGAVIGRLYKGGTISGCSNTDTAVTTTSFDNDEWIISDKNSYPFNAGGICGAANNLIYGLTTGDSITLIYALTSLFIGFFVGIMARCGFMKSFGKAILTSLVAAAAAIVVSTPLNIIFWGGQTGNVWGDAVFAAAQAASLPLWLSSLADEIIVDVPDKIITLILVYIILKALPDKLTTLYEAGDRIERLD